MKRNKYSIKFKEMLLFLYFYFVVFGNKLGSVDFNFSVSVLGILVVIYNKRSIVFPIVCRKLFLIIVSVFSIALISSLYNGNLDFNSVFRYIRVGISFLSIVLVVMNSRITYIRALEMLITVILIHSIISVLGAFNLDFQRLISSFTGYSRVYHLGRSTGLTIGFDIGGIISLIGLFLVSVYIIITGKKRTLSLIIFSLAAVLTTRFNMVLFLITLVILFFLFKKYKRRYELALIVMLFSFIGIISLSIIGSTILVNNGYNVPSIIYDFDSTIARTLQYSYAQSDITKVIDHHYDFSKINNWFIGDGYIPSVDPGYTITIYSIGIVGLVMSVVFYFTIIRNCTVKFFGQAIEMKLIAFSLVYWVVVVLAMSAKNNYLFTRNISELGFIMLCIYMNYKGQNIHSASDVLKRLRG